MTVNPEILTWARSTAGLTADDAARALGFSDTRDRSAAERLMALEAGEEYPSRSVLLRMSKAYRRALLVFYLPEPPRTGDRGQDFRTVPGGTPALYNPLLDALIRDIGGRQTAVGALLEETEPPPVDFIGAASMNDPTEDLANRIGERLQFSLDQFRVQATGRASIRLPSGNNRSRWGLCAASGQSRQPSHEYFRRCLPALHEMAHLWLGATGVSGASIEARIEGYCNDVAGEILPPTAEVRALAHLRKAPLAEVIEAVSTFANARNISRAMVAYKLLRANALCEPTWRQIADHLRQEGITSRRGQEQEGDNGESGGPVITLLSGTGWAMRC
ncbi:MAG TPA: hypothetical protein VN924_06175 [Bryobacteraceae bacterium]|nr:hypothetical protein [Bryobacteraceae bacterium]